MCIHAIEANIMRNIILFLNVSPMHDHVPSGYRVTDVVAVALKIKYHS